jgi:hypothetical protein
MPKRIEKSGGKRSAGSATPKFEAATITPGSVHYDVGKPPNNLRGLVCQACQVQQQVPDATDIGKVRVGDPDIITTLMGLTMNYGQFQRDVLWMNRLWGLAHVKTWGDFIAWVRTCYSSYHA